MSHSNEFGSRMRRAFAYRWCLLAYPPEYRAEHGDDILATIAYSHGDDSRPSVRECSALVSGGVRRRTADASSQGSFRALLSALRGAAMILLLFNAAVEITGLVHHWTAPTVAIPQLWGAIYLGAPNGEGVSALMWAGAILSVFAVGLLGAGFRRWSGFALLASGACVAGAADWLTGLGVHNTTLQAWGGVPFAAAFGNGGVPLRTVDLSLATTLLVPAALLMVLPPRRKFTASRRSGLVTSSAALLALVLGSVFIPWLGQNPGWALVVGVVAASALAPVDGRISLVASAVVLIYLPLLTRVPHSVDGLLPMSSAPWVPEILIGAVILAAWGWFWTDRRRAHPPAHFAN